MSREIFVPNRDMVLVEYDAESDSINTQRIHAFKEGGTGFFYPIIETAITLEVDRDLNMCLGFEYEEKIEETRDEWLAKGRNKLGDRDAEQ